MQFVAGPGTAMSAEPAVVGARAATAVAPAAVAVLSRAHG